MNLPYELQAAAELLESLPERDHEAVLTELRETL